MVWIENLAPNDCRTFTDLNEEEDGYLSLFSIKAVVSGVF